MLLMSKSLRPQILSAFCILVADILVVRTYLRYLNEKMNPKPKPQNLHLSILNKKLSDMPRYNLQK
jgi:hypothetical protein